MKFNREKSKQFKSLECNSKKKIEKFGKITLTSFGIIIVLFGSALLHNNLANNQKEFEKTSTSNHAESNHIEVSDYDRARAQYLEKLHQYRDEFTNQELYNFYKDGKVIVEYNGEKIESNLKALYLRYGYNDNNKFIFLSNVLNGRNVDFFTQEDNEYAEKQHIIEFRNTTIFENLYNKYSSNIVDNMLILNEEETKEFLSMISMWDGKINDMVPETMATENKQVWEGESNGKTR